MENQIKIGPEIANTHDQWLLITAAMEVGRLEERLKWEGEVSDSMAAALKAFTLQNSDLYADCLRMNKKRSEDAERTGKELSRYKEDLIVFSQRVF